MPSKQIFAIHIFNFSSKSPKDVSHKENSRKMYDTPFITCGSSIIPGCTIQGLQISDKYNYASSEDLQILRYLQMYEKNSFKAYKI